MEQTNNGTNTKELLNKILNSKDLDLSLMNVSPNPKRKRQRKLRYSGHSGLVEGEAKATSPPYEVSSRRYQKRRGRRGDVASKSKSKVKVN